MIRHLLATSAAASALLLCPLAINAQPNPQRSGDAYYQYDHHDRLMGRIQADLDSSQAAAAAFSNDGSRISQAREDLGIFARRMDDGNYDGRALTNSIVDIQRILDNNRLYVQNRQALLDDLGRLRNLRESYER